MRSRFILASIGVGSALAHCSCAEPSPDHRQQNQAVAEGASSEDEAVFALLVSEGSNEATCSASLISPRLAVTAAHCVTGQWQDVDCGTTMLEAPLDPSAFRLTNSANLQSEPVDVHFVGVRRVELYVPGGTICGEDIALLELGETLEDVPPLFPSPPAASEHEYRLVGYGAGHFAGTGEGIRRTSEWVAVECVGHDDCSDWEPEGKAGAPMTTSVELLDGEWLGPAGACPGDSGGPALDREGGILGIVSRGYEDCRLSIFSALDREWLSRRVREDARFGGYPVPSWAQLPDSTPTSKASGGASSTEAADATGIDPADYESPSMPGGQGGDSPRDSINSSDHTHPKQQTCACRLGPQQAASFPRTSSLILFLITLFSARRKRSSQA